MNFLSIPTSTGPLTLFEDNGAIIVIEWGQVKRGHTSPLLAEAKTQLLEYFSQKRKTFSLPLKPNGTTFQKAVWKQIQMIPYGETRTYGDIAITLNSSPRAVGGACGKNPIPIIIPCHRVTGGRGKMTGFSGGEGIHTKEALLRIET
jgi:methylated-DNA-[protein]-cysteine S-methyltransferase